MRQNFTVAGPFGELSGVINLCEVEAKRRNVLVMAHGFRGSMEGGGRAAQLADEIGESICSVVRFNFSRCTMLTNQIAELKTVLDFVRETLQPEKLFLLGRSFGGATCIVTACEGDCCADAAAENCSALQGKTVVLDDERGHDEIPATFVTDLLQYDVATLLQRWQNGPLLIIHGAKDCIVTPEQAKMNLEIAGGYKQLHYMEGDNHHLDLHYKDAGKLIKKWLKENS